MTEYAEMCRSKMRGGEIPPHNWQSRVTKEERRIIYDAWVEWYLDIVKSGKPLPKKGDSLCFGGLSNTQKMKIYEARGFGSDEMEREKKKRERKEWLDSHGGKHTQEVMKEAKLARKARKQYLRDKSYHKSKRKAARLGYYDPRRYYVGNIHRSYWEWTSSQKKKARRIKDEWKELRLEIIKAAKAYHARSKYLWQVERVFGADNEMVKIFRYVGLENLEEYILKEAPTRDWNFGFKINPFLRENCLKKDLLNALCALSVQAESAISRMYINDIKEEGSTKSSDACSQLRALGFVA